MMQRIKCTPTDRLLSSDAHISNVCLLIEDASARHIFRLPLLCAPLPPNFDI